MLNTYSKSKVLKLFSKAIFKRCNGLKTLYKYSRLKKILCRFTIYSNEFRVGLNKTVRL